MKKYKVSEILKMLKEDGWIMIDCRGSHRHFKHPVKSGKVTLNGKPSDVLSQFVLNVIFKSAGWLYPSCTIKINMEKIIINVDWEDNFAAYSDLVAVVATHKTLEGLKEAYTFSLSEHLKSMRKDGDEIPEALQGEYELHFSLNTRALLHYTEKYITRAAISRITGINEKQLGHYAQGIRNPRDEQRKKILNGIRNLGRELISVE